MFQTTHYLEKTKYVQFNLNTPLTFPSDNQTQQKGRHKFLMKDWDNFLQIYDQVQVFVFSWK